MRSFSLWSLPFCAINAQEHLLVGNHISGTVLGAAVSERRDRNSQLVGSQRCNTEFLGGKLYVKGFRECGLWGLVKASQRKQLLVGVLQYS